MALRFSINFFAIQFNKNFKKKTNTINGIFQNGLNLMSRLISLVSKSSQTKVNFD